jgi:transmembrane sensor
MREAIGKTLLPSVMPMGHVASSRAADAHEGFRMTAEREKVRGEAADWHILLHDAPDDETLRVEFQAWLAQSADHRSAWEALATTVEAIHRMPEERRGYDRSFLQRPRRHERPAQGHAHRKRGRTIAAAAVAAGVALLALPAVQLRLSADHLSSSGEVRTVSLPDGSTAILGPDSAIAVDYGAASRSIRLLQGQAHFDVVHDPSHPFRVAAKDIRTTVLGTAFDVRMVGDETTVAVARGRVRVQSEAKPSHFDRSLTTGQAVSISERGARSLQENPALVGSWQSGDVLLRDQSIAHAIDEVRPWFRGRILLMDDRLARRPLTGIYNLHDPVAALKLMIDPHGGRITQVTPWLLIVTGS